MAIRWSAGIALGFAMSGCSEPEPPGSPAVIEEGVAPKYLTSDEMAQVIDAPDEDEVNRKASRSGSSADYTFGVQTRDHQLWLHSGTEPQLYTVKSEDGKALAEGIDDGRLLRDYPELHEFLHDAVDLIGIGD